MSRVKERISEFRCLRHNCLVVGIARSIYHEFGSGDPYHGTTFKEVSKVFAGDATTFSDGDVVYSRRYALSHLQNRPPLRF